MSAGAGGMLRPSILHVIVKVQATNGQFNEHCLPLIARRDVSVVSFLEPTLPSPPSIRMFAGTGGFASGWRALRAGLRAATYDVVHVHAPQTGVVLLGAVAMRPSRLRNCVYTVQNSYANYRMRNRMLMVPIFAAYPQVVFCSQAALESMPRWLRWLTRDKATVVPNAVDVDAIDRATSSDTTTGRRDRFRVVLVGRLVPIKNMATVIEAVARTTSDVELEVIGDGPLRAEIEAIVSQRPVLEGRVTFAGLLERAEVHRRLAAADVCVSASLGEGLPVAVLEAMACQTPVLLSDIQPHREIGIDRPELALIECTDADGFAKAIDALAALSAAERSALGDRCRQIVDERFSIAAMHETYVPIYEAAAGRGTTPRHGLAWR